MTDRILIDEQDPAEPLVWRYGLANEEGAARRRGVRPHADRTAGGPPADLHGASLWVTAIFLVRQAEGRTRIVYDLRPGPVERAPEPPPQGSERPWEEGRPRAAA
jgi:hypothetical protein